MKNLMWVNLTAMLLCISCGIAVAEEPTGGAILEGRLLRRHEEVSRKARADQLRLERAHARAKQRLAQEARYERLGYSPLRPYTNTAYWSLGLPTPGGR